MPGFLDRFEIRPVGPLVGDEARNLAWMRLDPPRHARPSGADRAVGRLDAGRLLEARPPVRRADRRPHDPLPRAAGDACDWVLADYRSRFSAGGAWEEDGELWAPDGTLLAQSRQLALIRA